jgi:hypothetical protein
MVLHAADSLVSVGRRRRRPPEIQHAELSPEHSWDVESQC